MACARPAPGWWRGRQQHARSPDAKQMRPSPFPRGREREARNARIVEFFPPKTAEMEQSLWDSIKRLAPLATQFVSVTYGAGGSTRERTHATGGSASPPRPRWRRWGTSPASVPRSPKYGVTGRLCRGRRDATSSPCVAIRRVAPANARRRIPTGTATPPSWSAAANGMHDIGVAVAAYPENASRESEARRRQRHAQGQNRRRREARDHAVLFRYGAVFPLVDRVRGAVSRSRSCPAFCRCKISSQATNFAARAGASVPVWLAGRFQGLDNDPTTRKLIAASQVAAEQVLDLFDRGVTNFHFYTMNRADLVYAICHLLGLRPVAQPAA